MLSTGIVRKVDDLGRLVIPKELRKNLGLDEHTPMEIFVDGSKVILRKYVSACSICGDAGELVAFGEIKLCPNCIREIKRTSP